MRDSEFCFSHDPRPETVEKRQRARRAGGLASTSARYAETKLDLSSPEGMKHALASIARRVVLGTMTQRRAEIVTRAIRTAMRIEERLKAAQAQPRKVVHVVELASYAGGREDQLEARQGTNDGAR
jgi:hypothetical protein